MYGEGKIEVTNCKVDATTIPESDKLSKHLIESFRPDEIVDILLGVSQKLRAHFSLQIEGAKQNVERLLKETDSIFNRL